MTGPRRIRHAGLSLALHARDGGAGERVLLLHQLGGSSAEWGSETDGWTALGLDFAGHGDSDWRAGGAYTPELFAADADMVLATLGPCRLAGAGLGAYVALLVAGARPDLVPATLLLPGAGLDGSGPVPDFSQLEGFGTMLDELSATRETTYDPMVRTSARDVRPPDYARSFALAARRVLLAEDGSARPPWWEAVRDVPGARRVPADRRAAFADLREEVA